MDSFKPRKYITVFESITDRKTRVSRDAQHVCAITIIGTALNKRALQRRGQRRKRKLKAAKSIGLQTALCGV